MEKLENNEKERAYLYSSLCPDEARQAEFVSFLEKNIINNLNWNGSKIILLEMALS